MSGEIRLGWIGQKEALPLVRQCELAGVSRATVYQRRLVREESETDLPLCRLIDEEYTRKPSGVIWIQTGPQRAPRDSCHRRLRRLSRS